jgi:hypothetical protein
MALVHDAPPLGGSPDQQGDAQFKESAKFDFIPRELASKCRELIQSYHSIHGYGHLPDMLWHSSGRDVIECNRELAIVFNGACKTRRAKQANNSFILLATIVLSIEVLARDFAGWGKRFPVARRDAEAILVDFPQRRSSWFMDQYLYPSLTIHRGFAKMLAPSEAWN